MALFRPKLELNFSSHLILACSVLYVVSTNDSTKSFHFKGEGTKGDPYRIGTIEELSDFCDAVNEGNSFAGKYFIQTANIDMSSVGNWRPIGISGSGKYFMGKYDGQGHVLDNLQIRYDEENVGLFGVLAGEVRNLGIESGNIKGSCIGSIASHGTTYATIFNCYNKAVLNGKYRCGGIADNFQGRILYCWNLGEIENRDKIIAGDIASYSASVIEGCYGLKEAVPEGYTGEEVNAHIKINCRIISVVTNVVPETAGMLNAVFERKGEC